MAGVRHTEWLREQDAGEAPMGSSLLEEPICCGLGSYVAVRVLLLYEWLLHYFLPYLCHYSLTLDGGAWKVRDFKGYLSSSGRSGHRRKRREGQCDCMRTVWHSARTLAPLENWASTCVMCLS